MTTTTAMIDRAEINRRNAARSTGPRTPEGKARSRLNAVKPGCRARLPVLPGEDPEAYRGRLDAWGDGRKKRDASHLRISNSPRNPFICLDGPRPDPGPTDPAGRPSGTSE